MNVKLVTSVFMEESRSRFDQNSGSNLLPSIFSLIHNLTHSHSLILRNKVGIDVVLIYDEFDIVLLGLPLKDYVSFSTRNQINNKRLLP